MSTTVFLRRPAVQARCGLSRASIYSMMKRGEFPEPIRIGQKAVAWLEEDIVAWQQARIDAARSSGSEG